jgi:NTE family protein
MPKVKNLVISGGGISGIGILGILKYCDEYNILNDVENYVGTSIGSIISLLLIINYQYYDIYDFFKYFNLEKLINSVDIDNFFENYGFENSDKIIYVIKRLLGNKNISENITFNELYEISNKKLTITGVCLSDNNLYYFNHKLTPNMKVLTAIRISSSIPILFSPVKYDDKLWLDGGIIQNYPIEFCKNDIENTLGISIFDGCFNKCVEIDNVVDFMVNLIKCVAYGNNNLDISKYKNNTIKLVHEFNSFADFSVESNTIKEIYDLGYECAKEQHNIIEQFINSTKTEEKTANSNTSTESDDTFNCLFVDKQDELDSISSNSVYCTLIATDVSVTSHTQSDQSIPSILDQNEDPLSSLSKHVDPLDDVNPLEKEESNDSD